MSKRTCLVRDCENKHLAKGYCKKHYRRVQNHGRPELPTTEERFWAKVEFNDCWEWTGAKHPLGYGNFNAASHYISAHRFAYQVLVGDIPNRLVLDHLCRNTSCVNPDHLQPVLQSVNIRRGASPYAKKANARACVNGHPFSTSNTYLTKRGERKCRECTLKSNRESRKRKAQKARRDLPAA